MQMEVDRKSTLHNHSGGEGVRRREGRGYDNKSEEVWGEGGGRWGGGETTLMAVLQRRCV